MHRRLGCPVIEVSELSIEEISHRIIRSVEQRAAEAAGGRSSVKPKPRVPLWRWTVWSRALFAALILFYVLFTPFWFGLRVACVDRPSSGRGAAARSGCAADLGRFAQVAD